MAKLTTVTQVKIVLTDGTEFILECNHWSTASGVCDGIRDGHGVTIPSENGFNYYPSSSILKAVRLKAKELREEPDGDQTD